MGVSQLTLSHFFQSLLNPWHTGHLDCVYTHVNIPCCVLSIKDKGSNTILIESWGICFSNGGSLAYRVLALVTGAYKYLQIEFAKQGLTSPYICITALTSLANMKNAHG